MNDHRFETRRNMLKALALAAVLLVGALSDSFHRAYVDHAICPEHGELVHVADAAHGAHASARADRDSSGPSVVEHQAAAEQHEHCLFQAFARASTPSVPAPAATVTHPESALSGVVLQREAASAPIPPLSFAPKHSPPRA